MRPRVLGTLFLVIMALPFIVQGQDPSFAERDAKVVAAYDAKQNTTTVHFGPMFIWRYRYDEMGGRYADLRLSALFTYPGKELVRPATIFLAFNRIVLPDDSWEKVKSKELEIQADDKKYNLKQIQVVDSKRSANAVVEVIAVTVPLEDFIAIAKSRKVKMVLGGMRFELQKENLESMRKLAAQTGP